MAPASPLVWLQPSAISCSSRSLATVGRRELEERGEPLLRDPERIAPLPEALHEDQHQRLGNALGRRIGPDVHRPERGAPRLEPCGRGAVEQEEPRPLLVEAGELLPRLGEARLPGVARLVARRVRVGVAHLPELLDESVALVVLLELEEGRALGGREDRLDLLEPLAVLRRQIGGNGGRSRRGGRRQRQRQGRQQPRPGTRGRRGCRIVIRLLACSSGAGGALVSPP